MPPLAPTSYRIPYTSPLDKHFLTIIPQDQSGRALESHMRFFDVEGQLEAAAMEEEQRVVGVWGNMAMLYAWCRRLHEPGVTVTDLAETIQEVDACLLEDEDWEELLTYGKTSQAGLKVRAILYCAVPYRSVPSCPP